MHSQATASSRRVGIKSIGTVEREDARPGFDGFSEGHCAYSTSAKCLNGM